MRTYLDCYPCFLQQALTAARFTSADDEAQYAILQDVLAEMTTFELTSTPPELSARVHEIVRAHTHHDDPYREAKQASTKQALALYPRLKALVDEADTPLDTALRLAIAGNIIDLARPQDYDLQAVIERMLTQAFAVDNRDALKERLAEADEVLYLADNAGETVFDRLLIETLALPVIYVVKGGPALNDATREDAVAAGLDAVATVVSNGARSVGTLLDRCSDEFRARFAAAELVIAKGQANYETLSGRQDPRIFFLLQVKCPVIGRDLGTDVGTMIVKQDV